MKDQEVNFNIVLKSLATKDKPAEVIPGSIPELIGNMLLNPTFKDDEPVRKLILAQKIAELEKIVIDKAAFDLVIKAITHAKNSYRGEIIGGLLLNLQAIKWEA